MRYLLLFPLLCLAISSQAQDDPTRYVLSTTTGREYTGTLESDDGRELLFRSDQVGLIYFDKSEIKQLKPFTSKELTPQGEYSPTGPFTTRYAFTTNALPVKKGENYVKFGLLGPDVQFALTDRLTLGLMSTWIVSPMAVSAKYSFVQFEDELSPWVPKFSVGLIAGTTGYLNAFEGYGGLFWANTTFGNREHNLTFSAGYGFARPGNEVNDLRNFDIEKPYDNPTYRPKASGFAFSLGAITKVGAKASFVFDSMLFFLDADDNENMTVFINDPNFGPTPVTFSGYRGNTETLLLLVLMPGMRFQSSDKSAFQVCLGGALGQYSTPDDRASIPFPMIS